MNTSGMKPLKFRVLIKPIKVEEKTKGGIYMPDETRDREKFAIQKGVLVDFGELAFTEPDWLLKPQKGQMIMYDRYAGGSLVKGNDGEEYRLTNDEEICAILEE